MEQIGYFFRGIYFLNGKLWLWTQRYLNCKPTRMLNRRGCKCCYGSYGASGWRWASSGNCVTPLQTIGQSAAASIIRPAAESRTFPSVALTRTFFFTFFLFQCISLCWNHACHPGFDDRSVTHIELGGQTSPPIFWRCRPHLLASHQSLLSPI